MKNNTPYVSGDTYISNDEALRVYQNMGYTFDKGEFIKGMNVELEHQDVTDGSLVKTAMIAAAHLREVPNYYTLLLKYVEPKHEQLVGPDGTINGAPTSTRVKKMRKSQLQELIQEVLDEVMNEKQLDELSPETYRVASAARRAQALSADHQGAGSVGDSTFKIKPHGLAKAIFDKSKKIDAHADRMKSRKVASNVGLSKAAIGTLTKESKLKEYIREVLDELQVSTIRNAADKRMAQAEKASDAGNERLANKLYKRAEKTDAHANRIILSPASKRKFGVKKENTMNKIEKNLAVKRHGKDVVKKTGTRLPTSYEGPDAMGPTWDQQHTTIGRSSAKSGGLDNPNAAANRKAAFKENTMPTLQEILMEGKENRVLLTKLTVLMEKLQPDFTKVQATKMMELCSETHQLVNTLNTLPYTIYNHMDWKVLKMGLVQKLMEVKVEAEKINSEKLNTTSFIKALDELIVQ
jgi:hypothetical protein